MNLQHIENFVYVIALITEAAGASETSINFYRTTWRKTPTTVIFSLGTISHLQAMTHKHLEATERKVHRSSYLNFRIEFIIKFKG
jgi:hypothetical protein